MAKRQGELKELLEQAQKQPGLKELMIVYEQYELIFSSMPSLFISECP